MRLGPAVAGFRAREGAGPSGTGAAGRGPPGARGRYRGGSGPQGRELRGVRHENRAQHARQGSEPGTKLPECCLAAGQDQPR
jgi:hypothetical protein